MFYLLSEACFLERVSFTKQQIQRGCWRSEGENQAAFPKFLPSPSGTETFKANLPVGGEGGYALHARAHLGD